MTLRYGVECRAIAPQNEINHTIEIKIEFKRLARECLHVDGFVRAEIDNVRPDDELSGPDRKSHPRKCCAMQLHDNFLVRLNQPIEPAFFGWSFS